jgi:hypothetical protein
MTVAITCICYIGLALCEGFAQVLDFVITIQLGDVLELNDALFVLGLKKNLLSVSCLVDHSCRVSFEGQQCTISDCCLASSRTLAICVLDGGLYRLLVDLVALVHSSKKLDEPSSLDEAYVDFT